MIRPIAVPGTGESHPGDDRTEMPDPMVCMLSFVTQRLDPELFLPGRFVGYPATYGDPLSYEESVAEGLANLHAIVTAAIEADELILLLGYSQGAAIVRLYLAALAVGAYGDPAQYYGIIVGAGLVADPYRLEGQALGFDPGGSGLAGRLVEWPDGFLLQVAATRDPITSAPADSLLRDVADFTGWMSTDVTKLQLWMQSIIATVQDRGWQNANLDWGVFWLTGQRVNNAIDLAGGYLPRIEYKTLPWLPPVVINPGGGRHTCYGMELMPGTQHTYCEVLAQELNNRAQEVLAA